MGWFGSLCSSVGSAISSCFSAASSLVGSVVSSFANTILPKIADALGGPIGSIAKAIYQAFQVFKEDDTVEDIGDRAIQASEKGITLEGFADYESYMDKLRSFELDPEKSKETSFEKKMATGLFIGSLGVDKKLGMAEGTTQQILPLIASNPDFFNANRITNWLKGAISVISIVDYFTGSLKSPTERASTLDNIISMERETNPEKDRETVFQEVSGVAQELKKD